MTDTRPERVYGVLVRDGRVFLADYRGRPGLPGGVFRAMADDRKGELRAHLYDALGIDARAIWAQGAFLYQHPDEMDERFSGFYTVWEWDGEIPQEAGTWEGPTGVASANLPPSLKILLTSVLATQAIKTT
ncbi:MAG TPA: hypothetical protein VIH05_00040 [Tepidiformaceae bacterium]